MPRLLTVILVDDHPLFREGLKRIVETAGTLRLVGEAATLDEARTAIGSHKPDLVLLDIAIQGGSGMRLVREIKTISPHTRMLVVSSNTDPALVEGAFHAGASGFLTKTAGSLESVKALNRVAGGDVYLDPELTQSVAMARLRPGAAASAATAGQSEKLTNRERQVLQMVSQGLYTREIASMLGLSTKTVEHHRCRLMRKLGCRNSAEVVAWAHRAGLFTEEAPRRRGAEA
ncbi:response regulator [Megalodesulfovibrio gigas]|uniref:Putative two component transcriptional regulator, LuxR family n=1 Tax=Megalodesulfovibrio gigas (strain ATCC 19364 / DSM 1382 / NCIMB 9332 / VKM B-1759) TaxID=1121448 RepID=T2G7R7_MEGG1|nr:response regulator transcription factor [Megalodesulfovibrio gigas]AGW12234.1 putative two component transcriptional regulator, LuxR family [Megalodesulfovibrio gigas DSM 1382 = ATCC 19364]